MSAELATSRRAGPSHSAPSDDSEDDLSTFAEGRELRRKIIVANGLAWILLGFILYWIFF